MSNFFFRQGVGASAGLWVHEATRNLPGLRQFRREGPAPAPLAWVRDAMPGVEAAAVVSLQDRGTAQAPASMAQVFMRRRSVRSYADEALSLEELAAFLRLSYPQEVTCPDYRPEDRPHQQLSAWNGHVTLCRLVLLVQRVQGLAPGAYLVDERQPALRLLRLDEGGAMARLLQEHCFQAEFRSAPVLALQVGSLHDAVQRYGERGYRYMLLEDGVQVQRMYLAATALKLAACVTGSLVQGEFEHWLGLDGYHATVLNAFALGHHTAQARALLEGLAS